MSRHKLLKKASSAVISASMMLGMIPMMAQPVTVIAAADTPYNRYGNIQVVEIPADNTAGYKRQLCDAEGNPIQLKGMSTFGLQWEEGEWILNTGAFDTLADDWKCDVVRLAMYVTEGGYASKPAELLAKVEEGIKLATDRGMYVIVDWHVLNDGSGNPNADVCSNAGKDLPQFAEIKADHPEYTGPQLFFAYLSQEYGDQGNVLFETANEPNGNGGQDNRGQVWEDVLLPYHQKVVDAIREYDADDNDNIVICGTDNWSQFVDAPIGREVVDENDQIMYTFHFYSGTHDTAPEDDGSYWLGSMIDNAIDNGLGVFCTEWGTSRADGDKGPYINYSLRWLEYMEENQISWCAWSLAKKNETSAALLKTTPTDPNADGVPGWSSDELSVTGNFLRAMIRGEEAPTYDAYFTALDFDTEGQVAADNSIPAFSLNSDNPNAAITCEAKTVDDDTFALVSNSNYGSIWNNRINLKFTGTYGIYQNLIMDIIIPTDKVEAGVEVAPVMQNELLEKWWMKLGPENGYKLSGDDFEEIGEGYSKATLVAPIGDIITDPTDEISNLVILFSADGEIGFDNVGFFTKSNGDISTQPKIPDTPGSFQGIPWDFEEGGRQGWAPEGTSIIDYLNIKINELSDGNHVMSFPVAFTNVGDPKDYNAWETGVRLSSSHGVMNKADTEIAKSITMDVYLESGVGTTGAIQFSFNPIPNGGDFWYTGASADIVIGKGEATDITVDGTSLVKYTVSVPFTANGDTYPNYAMRNLVIVCHNADSDYEGNVYYDNITISEDEPIVVEPETPEVPETPTTPVTPVTPAEPEMTKVEEFVNRLYNTVLGRDADPDGLKAWSDSLVDSSNCGTVAAAGFFFSDEYIKQDNSNEKFVKDLYLTLLDREAEGDGLAAWVAQLDAGVSRDEVFAGIANSDEYARMCANAGIIAGHYIPGMDLGKLQKINAFVDRLYRLCLGRRGDTAGQAGWVTALVNGTNSGAECAYGFFFSDEFVNSGISNENYVETLYNVFLDRHSESNGLAAWTDVLDSNGDKMEIFRGFAHSDEYTAICESYGIVRGNV